MRTRLDTVLDVLAVIVLLIFMVIVLRGLADMQDRGNPPRTVTIYQEVACEPSRVTVTMAY